MSEPAEIDTAAIRELGLGCPQASIGLTTGDCTCVSRPIVDHLCAEIDRLRARLAAAEANGRLRERDYDELTARLAGVEAERDRWREGSEHHAARADAATRALDIAIAGRASTERENNDLRRQLVAVNVEFERYRADVVEYTVRTDQNEGAQARALAAEAAIARVLAVLDAASGDHIGGVTVVRVPMVRAALGDNP